MGWFYSPLNLSYLKMFLLAAALILWVLRYRLKPLSGGWPRYVVNGLLAVLTVISIASYFHFGNGVRGNLANYHDVYHYYLGSKYSTELGYSNLYLCSLIADTEMNNLTHSKNIKMIRSLDNYGFIKVEKALKQKDRCKKQFSEQRWNKFKKDLLFFQKHEKTRWIKKIQDKGYNATPLWNVAASIISNLTPIDETSIKYLVLIDILLMLLAFLFVAFAFGPETAFLAAIVFFASYALQPTHIRGGFLRYDWIATLLISISLLKKKKYTSSGAMLALSVASRIFPVFLAAGLGLRLIVAVFSKSKEAKRYLAFFAAFTLTLATLIFASVAYYGDTQYLQEFTSKIDLHNNDISTTRVGLKYLFLNRGEMNNLDFEKIYGDYGWTTITRYKKILWSHMKPFYLATVLMLLALWFFLQRKLEDHESFAFAFPLIFLLTAPTFYYYIAFCVFPLAFADGKDRRFLLSSTIMILGWMALFIINNALEYWWSKYFFMSVTLAAAIMIIMLIFAASDPAVKKGYMIMKEKLTRSKKLIFAGLFVLLVISAVAVAMLIRQPDKITDGLPVAADDGSRAVFVAGGDMNLGRNIERIYQQSGAEYLAEGLLPEISNADLLFANLECALTRHDVKRPKLNKPIFHIKADPGMTSLLDDLGVDVVSLANNHSMDYGCEGLSEELAALSSTRVQFGGAGMDWKSASKPNIMEVKGIKVGFLHYTTLSADAKATKTSCGINNISLNPLKKKDTYKRLRNEIRKLRKQADLVFVTIHWGANYSTDVRGYMVDFAREAIAFGAHGIIGHHAHQLLGMDSYMGRPILYDTGNFLFDSMDRSWTNRQGIFRMELAKNGVKSVEFVPYYFQHPERRAIKANKTVRLQTLKRMQNLSEQAGGETELRDDRLFLVLK